MNFKADWSFLEKISMGAVASKEIIKQLNDTGHEVIELERYSTSNKIWTTKIKRLRLPDLVCLKCGRRIESRAKSNLDVRMSDNENNQDRRWDVGLRDQDIVAFIRCKKDGNKWVPASEINFFETISMRSTVAKSKLGNPKSIGEGAERDRIWPTCIPKKDGKILDIIYEADNTKIKVKYTDDGNYTYSFKKEKGYHVYCAIGNSFVANETMIAGVPMEKVLMDTCTGTYDFLGDLESEIKEVRYAGVKALGYLERKQIYIDKLRQLQSKENDYRISLEIYSSLIRLGEDVWDEFQNYAMSLTDEAYRLEYVLILGELSSYPKATYGLCNIAFNSGLESELRSAAAWGMDVNKESLPQLIKIARDKEDSVASHAIAHIIESIDDGYTESLINSIDDDVSGGIILKILTEARVSTKDTLISIYKSLNSDIKIKWCAMTIGMLGANMFSNKKKEIESIHPDQYTVIKTLWDYSKSSVSEYRSGEIDFLRKQNF